MTSVTGVRADEVGRCFALPTPMKARPPGRRPGGFQQRLGLFDATMLVAGTMIGSGIFIVSADIARDVGSSGWLWPSGS